MAVYVNGAREIEDLLKKLPERVSKRVVTASLRVGARIIAKQARANLRANPSVDSGLLEKSISSRARKKSKAGSAVVSVGAIRYKPARLVKRKGSEKAVKASPSRYAHLVEFGTANMQAEPFLRPALDEKAIEAIAKIGEALGRGIDREAAKMAAGKVSFTTGKRIK